VKISRLASHGDIKRVPVAEVVAAQYERPFCGDVLPPLNPRRENDAVVYAQHRAHKAVKAFVHEILLPKTLIQGVEKPGILNQEKPRTVEIRITVIVLPRHDLIRS
jgi:hypothetical protein